jgi:DNA-directed RNA polymerase II subunit RPB2
MTPYIARMNNLTYSSSLFVKVHIIIEILNENGIPTKIDKYVNNVYIGKIPIMTRSDTCVLTQIPAVGNANNDECRYDFGGYFIVNGNEKVLIMQDRINENETLVFVPNNNNDGIYAEIRSMSDSSYLPPKTTSLNMVGKLNHMGRNIRLNTSFLKSEVPVFIMFRALGIISDKEIIQHIVYDLDNKDNQRIINQLMACCEDACDIHNQEQAEEYLIRNMTGVNKNTSNPTKILRDNIINDFLGHVGNNYRRKALYLGYMINKMIRIYIKYDDYDNRDSYMNKRIDTAGVLMSNLFRQCYGKMTKEIKGLIERELNLWRASHTSITTDIISDNNIHRYFKHSLLDSWLKYSLSF